MKLLLLLSTLFIGLNCAEIGNPPGGLKIVEAEQKGEAEQELAIAGLPHVLEKLVIAYHANAVRPLHRAYIHSAGSKIGAKSKNLHVGGNNNCYYKRPTFKFLVLFENPVARTISNKFVQFVTKHGDYVSFNGYGHGKNGNNHSMPFATTMNEKEFQELVDKANVFINK